MTDRRGLTRRAALGLIGAGGLVSVASTMSRTHTTAERTTVLATASDSEDAYVGLEATNETIQNRQDSAIIYRIWNNTPETLTLSTDVSFENSDRLATVSDGSGSLSPGQASEVEVECAIGGNGSATVTVAVAFADGTSLTVRNASNSRTITFSCTGGGPGNRPNDIDTNGRANINNGETVGNVRADNGANVKDGGTVRGNLCTGGATTVNGQVDGDVVVDSTLNINGSGSIGGTIRATGSITVDGVVEGDAISYGSINVNGGPVEGDVTENYSGTIDLCH